MFSAAPLTHGSSLSARPSAGSHCGRGQGRLGLDGCGNNESPGNSSACTGFIEHLDLILRFCQITDNWVNRIGLQDIPCAFAF